MVEIGDVGIAIQCFICIMILSSLSGVQWNRKTRLAAIVLGSLSFLLFYTARWIDTDIYILSLVLEFIGWYIYIRNIRLKK